MKRVLVFNKSDGSLTKQDGIFSLTSFGTHQSLYRDMANLTVKLSNIWVKNNSTLKYHQQRKKAFIIQKSDNNCKN